MMLTDALFFPAVEITATNLRVGRLDAEKAQVIAERIAAEIIGHARMLECLATDEQ